MSLESFFGIANSAALGAWVVLILAPRWRWLLPALAVVVPGLLSVAYAALIGVYFFRVEGGGFGSLAEVKTLFTCDPVVLAGWLHYLAFDLLVGVFIAWRSDRLGINRLIQAPILILTFMFGPAGLLVHLGSEVAQWAAANSTTKFWQRETLQ